MYRLAGPLIWGISALAAGRPFLVAQWETVLLWFAGLVLVPEGLRLLAFRSPEISLGSFAGLLLPMAYLIDVPWVNSFSILGYAVFWCWIVFLQFSRLFKKEDERLMTLVALAACLYGLTGSLWAVFSVLGIQPLGFDAVITRLTAAHFMVAGFTLTVVIFLLMKHVRGKISHLLGRASLLGMPLVALGITVTHFGGPWWVEATASLGFVGMAALTAILQWRLSGSNVLMKIGSICLIWGLLWAALYGLRFYYPTSFVHIPNMKIWHGTVQTLGFGWLSLVGWLGVEGRE